MIIQAKMSLHARKHDVVECENLGENSLASAQYDRARREILLFQLAPVAGHAGLKTH